MTFTASFEFRRRKTVYTVKFLRIILVRAFFRVVIPTTMTTNRDFLGTGMKSVLERLAFDASGSTFINVKSGIVTKRNFAIEPIHKKCIELIREQNSRT